MLEPRIEFKKVKTFMGMEGQGLNADIYINGVKCFFMRDGGDGGETDFDRYDIRTNINPDIERNVQLVDAWIATIPDEVYTYPKPLEDGRTELRIKIDYAIYFDEKYNDYLKAKDTLKFEKKKMLLYKTAIVFGDANTPDKYSFLNMKKPLSEFPKAWLQLQVDNAKAKYIKGNVQFLNKNHISSLGINI